MALANRPLCVFRIYLILPQGFSVSLYPGVDSLLKVYEQVGHYNGPEFYLQGLPLLKGLVGPFTNEITLTGELIVRYENPEAHILFEEAERLEKLIA